VRRGCTRRWFVDDLTWANACSSPPNPLVRLGTRWTSLSAVLEAERGEVFDKLRQTEESPRVRLHARVRSLAFPAQALAVLQEQELDEAQRELEGLEAVDAPNWFDRFVPDTNELHGTVGILIQRLRSAYPQFDQLFGLASELELARRDHATQGN